jgi:serine/threonine-protein kinase
VVLGFTGLIFPVGVAVDPAGNAYVADTGNNRAVKLPVGGGAQVVLGFASLISPRGVAVDGAGNVFVTATGNDRVLKLPAAGGLQVDIPFNGIDGPFGIAVDATGNIYFSDASNNRVLKVSAGGGSQSTLGFAGLNGPRGIAVDGSGNVYVADTGNNRIVKLPAGGGAQTTLGFTGLIGPHGVAVDGSGNVYVTDNNVLWKLPAGGGPQVNLNFGNLINPGKVAVDAAGTVYATSISNQVVIKKTFEGTGPQSQVGFTGLTGPRGIAVDGPGNVYVTDYSNTYNRVVKLPVGGGAQITLNANLSSPEAVAVDGPGNAYIADSDANRVLEVPAGDTGNNGGRALPITGVLSIQDVAVDGSGNVYVVDFINNRVVKLTTSPPQLRVTTNPAVPADITVDGIARDSWGLNWVPFAIGPHEVCFGDVPGYTKPPCQNVTMTQGATSVVQGNYTANGYLRVITSPAVATTISVAGVARNDWGLWTEIPPGTYSVCFGKVAGLDVPACRDVVVAAGATSTTTGTFTANAAAPGPTTEFGYLRATTSPAVNSMISVDGLPRNNWGLDWVKLPVGSHEVCFGPAPNTTAPASCTTTNVTNGATATVTGTFAPKGFLRVLTSPSLPATITVNGQIANAYGMWTAKTPGTYTVCFGYVAGYTTPACQNGLDLDADGSLTLTGTYLAARGT